MALIACKECGAQVSDKAGNCPSCGVKINKPTSVLTWVVGGFFGLFILGSIVGGNESSSNGTNSSTSSESSLSPKEMAIQKMKLDFDWSKGGFDSIMMLDLKINNSSKVDVKDIEIKCEDYSNSGTNIDNNEKTLYEIVKAGETKKFKKFNMGFIHSQAQKTSCSIVDLTVM
ncbi:MAG: hypothetical protein NVSMB40_11090 [Aquirhabdus sp.]